MVKKMLTIAAIVLAASSLTACDSEAFQRGLDAGKPPVKSQEEKRKANTEKYLTQIESNGKIVNCIRDYYTEEFDCDWGHPVGTVEPIEPTKEAETSGGTW